MEPDGCEPDGRDADIALAADAAAIIALALAVSAVWNWFNTCWNLVSLKNPRWIFFFGYACHVLYDLSAYSLYTSNVIGKSERVCMDWKYMVNMSAMAKAISPPVSTSELGMYSSAIILGILVTLCIMYILHICT